MRSGSKAGSRSNAKSRGGVSAVESHISKNSFDKVGNDSAAMEKLNDQLREGDISPVKFSRSRGRPILVQQQPGEAGGSNAVPRFIPNGPNLGTSNFQQES